VKKSVKVFIALWVCTAAIACLSTVSYAEHYLIGTVVAEETPAYIESGRLDHADMSDPEDQPSEDIIAEDADDGSGGSGVADDASESIDISSGGSGVADDASESTNVSGGGGGCSAGSAGLAVILLACVATARRKER
jgi:hypothetical protein